MDAWHELNIRLQMEVLITEREGMIAENKQREHHGQGITHTEDEFSAIAGQFIGLLDNLRQG